MIIIVILSIILLIFIFSLLLEKSDNNNSYSNSEENINPQWKQWYEKDKWDYVKNQPIIPESFEIYKPLTYEELLQTPIWYSKRNEIISKRGHKCEWCKAKKHLQLHHKYYLKYPNNQKIEPWNYPDDAFIVLCESCHKKAHKKYKIKTYYTEY